MWWTVTLINSDGRVNKFGANINSWSKNSIWSIEANHKNNLRSYEKSLFPPFLGHPVYFGFHNKRYGKDMTLPIIHMFFFNEDEHIFLILFFNFSMWLFIWQFWWHFLLFKKKRNHNFEMNSHMRKLKKVQKICSTLFFAKAFVLSTNPYILFWRQHSVYDNYLVK